jgi:hypothetical protein
MYGHLVDRQSASVGKPKSYLADLEQLRRDGFEVLISLLKRDEQAPRYDVAAAVALGFRR